MAHHVALGGMDCTAELAYNITPRDTPTNERKNEHGKNTGQKEAGPARREPEIFCDDVAALETLDELLSRVITFEPTSTFCTIRDHSIQDRNYLLSTWSLPYVVQPDLTILARMTARDRSGLAPSLSRRRCRRVRVGSSSDDMGGGVTARLPARDRAGLEYGVRESEEATVLDACKELAAISVKALGHSKRNREGGEVTELVDGRHLRKEESKVYTVPGGSAGHRRRFKESRSANTDE